MNRPSICWKCVNREGCKMFNKNPEAKVTDCERFLMKKEDEAIMQELYELNLLVEREVKKNEIK